MLKTKNLTFSVYENLIFKFLYLYNIYKYKYIQIYICLSIKQIKKFQLQTNYNFIDFKLYHFIKSYSNSKPYVEQKNC